MSRRLGNNRHQEPEARRGRIVPLADQCVTLDIIDPGGHRMLRIGRGFDETNARDAWYSADTLGANALFEHEENEAGEWSVLWFTCKACRDAGLPMESRLEYSDALNALDELWMVYAPSRTPRRSRLNTMPVDQSGSRL